MNQITDPYPQVTQAGYEFNYAQWNADTVITLVNVPWNNDYRDVWKAPSGAALDAYLNSRPTSERLQIPGARYAPINEPVDLDIPIDRAYQFNYLRAANPAQPISTENSPTSYYYFIVDVVYVAPNTTRFILQLDIWQSFERRVEYGNCYIVRGHAGIANENAFDNFGRNYLTVQEGLDTGSDYRVISKRKENVANLEIDTGTSPPTLENLYDVLVVSATDLTADAGDASNPVVTSASGGGFQMTPSGATFYVFNNGSSSLAAYLTAMKDKPWVTQGIISITIIPSIKRYKPDFVYQPNGVPTKLNYGLGMFPLKYSMFNNWRDSSEILNNIPAKYRHLKKFLTFPYMAIELTTWYGASLVIKPECWADANASILERVSFTPPNQRIGFHPRRYNSSSATTPIDDLYDDLDWMPGYTGDDGDDNGDYLDAGVYITSFPNAPIVNDMAVSYLASNAHGLNWQNDSASWSQQRALRGNDLAYDQASKGMETQRALTRTSIDAMTGQMGLQNDVLQQQSLLNAVSGTLTGGAMGMIGGPAGGAVGLAGGAANAAAGLARVGIQQDANRQSLAINSGAARGALNANQSQAGFNRDTNRQLADWAARGDYENTIAGINAKIQDSRMVQPSMSGQFGGDGMNFNNNTVELNVRWKMLDAAHIRTIGDYWLRYGYAVNQFGALPANLMVMTKFTYWKLSETYITKALMPEPFKQAIRGMFEKGLTVWADPDDMGNIDIGDNMPVGGYTL